MRRYVCDAADSWQLQGAIVVCETDMCLVLDTTADCGNWVDSHFKLAASLYADLQRKPGGLGPLVPRSILPSDSVICTAAVCCHGIRQSTCLAGSKAFESDRKGAIVPIVWNTLSAALVYNNRHQTNEQF